MEGKTMDAFPALVGGVLAGGAAGYAARSVFGDAANPCRGQEKSLIYAAGITGVWWTITYPGGQPVAGAAAAGFGFGFLFGQIAHVIVKAIRKGGPGDGGGGHGGWGGGGGGWEPPEPWGPGPTDFKPQKAPSIVEGGSARLTMEDFAKETAVNPAPAEPSPLVPSGR